MNPKLRRLVCTPLSEQYALFDLDKADASHLPLSIGKIGLHLTTEGVFGTFLLRRGGANGLPPDQVHDLVESTVQELCEPMGVPAPYAIEYSHPTPRIMFSSAAKACMKTTPRARSHPLYPSRDLVDVSLARSSSARKRDRFANAQTDVRSRSQESRHRFHCLSRNPGDSPRQDDIFPGGKGGMHGYFSWWSTSSTASWRSL
jgi:hypothetical protein